jgi:hypothetical protein
MAGGDEVRYLLHGLAASPGIHLRLHGDGCERLTHPGRGPENANDDGALVGHALRWPLRRLAAAFGLLATHHLAQLHQVGRLNRRVLGPGATQRGRGKGADIGAEAFVKRHLQRALPEGSGCVKPHSRSLTRRTRSPVRHVGSIAFSPVTYLAQPFLYFSQQTISPSSAGRAGVPSTSASPAVASRIAAMRRDRGTAGCGPCSHRRRIEGRRA